MSQYLSDLPQVFEHLTRRLLKFEQVHFYYLSIMCLKLAGGMANSIGPDQTSRYMASDLDLHCLLRPVCSNI